MMIGKLRPRWLKCIARHRVHGIVICGIAAAIIVTTLGAETPKQPFPEKPSELFQEAHLWTVHFKFTPEQWTAMEPKQSGGGFFGGGPQFGFGPSPGGRAEGGERPRGGNGPQQPSGFGGAPGGFGRGDAARGGPGGPRGGFGPSMILAPLMLKDGDQNGDRELTEKEFRALGEKWFAQWDKQKHDKLSAEELRDGLNQALAQPVGGPPGFGGPGRGPGMNLQGPQGKRNGLASAMGVEFTYVHADMELEGRNFKDVGVRYKGNGTFLESRGANKRSLKVDLNDFVPGQKLAGVTQLNLHSNVTDPSSMNEVLAHRLFRDARVPAPRTAYARVYVTVPGKFDREYFGLYSLVEDVGKAFVVDNFGSKKGALFKPVTSMLFTDLGDDWNNYIQTYDPKTEVRASEKRRLIELCQLVTHADDATFAKKIGDYLELDEFARYMAVTVWLSDLDGILGPGQNMYLYLHPLTGRIHFIPWDQDHSFGQMRGSQEQRENLSIHKPWQGDNRFLERMFKAEAFKKTYLAQLNELNQNLSRPERLNAQVDQLADIIRPAVRDESEEKLARFERVVAGEAPQPAGFGGFGRPPAQGDEKRDPRARGGEGQQRPGFFPGGFFQSAKPIKGFATARFRSVNDQAAGKSKGDTIDGFGFGGGGNRGPGPGGPDGRGRGGRGPGDGGAAGPPGGPGGMGPGMFLAGPIMAAFDGDKNETISREEFVHGFAKWFEKWRQDKASALNEEQLRTGIDRDLASGPFGFPAPDRLQPRGGVESDRQR